MAPTKISRQVRNRRAGGGARDPEGTRKALVESALKLFEELGYDATPVQRIVDDAGLTKGSFYHHFESKEDLLRELHDKFIDVELARARELLERDAPADELLKQFVTEVLMEPLSVYKAEISVFYQGHRFLSDRAFAEIKTKRDEFERCVVELIERGIKSGVFWDVGSPKLVAFGVIGMCSWAYTWLDPKGAVTPREIGEIYGRILVDGLRGGSER
jgi:AcrR family transcriptional regulator